jgi:hypothetical protein
VNDIAFLLLKFKSIRSKKHFFSSPKRAYPPNDLAIPCRVGTRKLCKKSTNKIRIIGEKSIPAAAVKGRKRLILERRGSVTSCRNLTMGLYGSGLTQEIIARPTITHMYAPRTKLIIFAKALIKFDITNIQLTSIT